MIITIGIPEGTKLKPVEVQSDTSKVSFEQNGHYIKVSASSEKKGKSNIELIF